MKLLTFNFLSLVILWTSSILANDHHALLKQDYSELKRSDFIKLHKAFELFIVKIEKKATYPSYRPSQFSYYLERVYESSMTINKAYAAGNENLCMFAGWVSKRQGNGRCALPWHARVFAKNLNVKDYGPKCGADHLIRCNPTMFGPGPTREDMAKLNLADASGAGDNYNPNAGICLDMKGSYKGLTKRCSDVSKRLDEVRGKNWLKALNEDDFKNYHDQQFAPLQKQVSDFCERSPNAYYDQTCDSLIGKVSVITREHQLLHSIDKLNDTTRIIESGAGNLKQDCLPLIGNQETTNVSLITAKADDVRELPILDEPLYNTLAEDRAGCLDDKLNQDQQMSDLYDALAMMMADTKCASKIKRIKLSSNKGGDSSLMTLGRRVKRNLFCKINVDPAVESNGNGKVTIYTKKGNKAIQLDWSANMDNKLTTKDWLYGGEVAGHKGFYQQQAFKDLCQGTNESEKPTLASESLESDSENDVNRLPRLDRPAPPQVRLEPMTLVNQEKAETERRAPSRTRERRQDVNDQRQRPEAPLKREEATSNHVPIPAQKPFSKDQCWALGTSKYGKIASLNAKSFYDALEALKSQHCPDQIESIKVLSGSTDVEMGECDIKIHPNFKNDTSGKIEIRMKSGFNRTKTINWSHISFAEYDKEDWLEGHEHTPAKTSPGILTQLQSMGYCK